MEWQRATTDLRSCWGPYRREKSRKERVNHDGTNRIWNVPSARRCSKRWRSVGRQTRGLLSVWREDDKGRHMIYKILGGIVLALVVLVLVALEVRTTGSYERTFNASQDKVWRVWTDPDSIKQWWGPTGYTAPFIRNDLRVDGTYLWAMKSAKGEMFWNTGIYQEVVPDRRIVSTLSFADETGKAIPGSKAPVPGRWPNAVTVIVEFNESNGKTKVTVTEVGLPLFVKLLSKVAWDQQFDKIEGLL
jgi:uncharacterized protein YndB with AHSA1/START domain